MGIASTTSKPPVDTADMFQRAAVAQNMNRDKMEKLEHPGFFGAIKDKITFQSKKHQEAADALRQANQLIEQMLEKISQAYANMH